MKPTVCVRWSLAAALLMTACDKASEIDFDRASEPTQTIAYLKSFCTTESVTLARQIVVQGVVTANDRYGEFFKTLVIEDASGGISIAIDHLSLADDFPMGAEVTVQCNGLALGDYGGKIQLGAAPDDTHSVGRIPRERIGSYICRSTSGELPRKATPLLFADIAAQHIDTYVRFDGVHFAEQGAWCDIDPATQQPLTTQRQIVDAAGHRFSIRTLGSCIYAKEPVPQGTGSIYGVIDYFNGRYALRVTNRKTIFIPAAIPPTACLSVEEYSSPTPMK